MPQYVAVVFVHGISNRAIDFASPMQRALLSELPNEKIGYVDFASVEWAGKVRHLQSNFMSKVQGAYPDIVDNRLRRFLLGGLGDAAAYQKTRPPANSSYSEIQTCITDTLARLDRDHEKKKNRPLIFIGHSLGCHIISSYAWDLNKLKQRTQADIQMEPLDIQQRWKELQEASKFRRLETFAGFVTLGSNMPLFTFAFARKDVRPITSAPDDSCGRTLKAAFPGIALDGRILGHARWLNFFSKRDILGFPLKPLYEAFEMDPILEDVCVKSESLRTRFVPYWSFLSAHKGYWTNRTVIGRTANLISNIIG